MGNNGLNGRGPTVYMIPEWLATCAIWNVEPQGILALLGLRMARSRPAGALRAPLADPPVCFTPVAFFGRIEVVRLVWTSARITTAGAEGEAGGGSELKTCCLGFLAWGVTGNGEEQRFKVGAHPDLHPCRGLSASTRAWSSLSRSRLSLLSTSDISRKHTPARRITFLLWQLLPPLLL
jgi:hypothetical protein